MAASPATLTGARTGTRRIVLTIGLGAMALALEWFVTKPPALALNGDSAAYLEAAKSLARSGTLLAPNLDWRMPDSLVPLAWAPPATSAAVAVPIKAGMAPVHAARLVQAIAAAVTIGVLFWLGSAAAGLLAGGGLAVAVMVTPAVVSAHQALMSEPLFIAFLVVMLALMALRPERPIWYGAAAAAACMARYAGAPFIGVAAVWATLCASPSSRRLRAAVTAAAPGVLALGWWLVRTMRDRGHASAIRQLGVYGGLARTSREGFGTAVRWLVPGIGHDAARAAVAFFVALCLVWVAVVAVRSHKPWSVAAGLADEGVAQRLLVATGITWLGYSAFVVIARLVGDPDIPFDDRIGAPAIVCLEIGIGILLVLWWRSRTWRARRIAGLALAVWAALAVRLDFVRVREARAHGTLYTESAHAASPVMQWARGAGAPRMIFSNAPATLYFNARRFSAALPLTWDSASLQAFRDTLDARHGVVIVFDYPSGKVPAARALVRELRLAPLQRFGDATVWADPERSSAGNAQNHP